MIKKLTLSCVVFALACTQPESEGHDPGICEPYIGCVEAAAPQMLTAAIAAYGSEGTCWSIAGATEANCHTECRASLVSLSHSSPELEQCFECLDDADCSDDAPYCIPDTHLCRDYELTLSCDHWSVWGECREFSDDFTDAERQDSCEATSTFGGLGLESASGLPCKTEGAWGRCEVTLGGQTSSFFYYFDGPEDVWTEAAAEASCSDIPGTWIPF